MLGSMRLERSEGAASTLGRTSQPEPGEAVATIRAFSRFYTRVLGLLDQGLLGTPYSLTEARVIYELAQRDNLVEVQELRQILGLDPGYLSRILSRLSKVEVANRERAATDGRRQVVGLTRKGRREFALLDRRADGQVADLLGRVDGADQRRLLAAMQAIEHILDQERAIGGSLVLRPAMVGDYGWIVERHGALYAQEYRWDETFEALVARVVADYVEQRGRLRDRVAAWIAEIDGDRVGCVLCMQKNATTAQLRLLLVEPRARGAGVGTRLVEQCLRFARQSGYDKMLLWTNDVLVDARRIYERAGFTLLEEAPHHSFGHDLVGQTWQLDLR